MRKKNLTEKKIRGNIESSSCKQLQVRCDVDVDFIYFGGQGQNNITRIYECTSTINATHSCAYGCLYFANCYGCVGIPWCFHREKELGRTQSAEIIFVVSVHTRIICVCNDHGRRPSWYMYNI